jgi:hypothetical protein
MMGSRLTKFARRLALGGALGLLALGSVAPGTARAQDSYFNSMLKGLGLGDDNQIEYRERPPLVVPSSRDLPPPQTGAKAPGPNWPAQANDKPKRGTQIRDLDRIPVAPQPAQPSVAAGTPGVPGASPSNPPPSTPAVTADLPQTPAQPTESGGLFSRLFSSGGDKPVAPIAPAPARKSLTEPPADYESPSAAQPYGSATPPAPPRADAAKAATPEATRIGGPGL